MQNTGKPHSTASIVNLSALKPMQSQQQLCSLTCTSTPDSISQLQHRVSHSPASPDMMQLEINPNRLA